MAEKNKYFVDGKDYAQSDTYYGMPMQDGLQLIARLNASEFRTGCSDVIMDVGCGSGNYTLELCRRMKHKSIIGFDMDQSMIEEARKNYNDENVTYITEDMSVQWPQMNPQIQQLEGQVSLIIANYLLHWIPKPVDCLKNLHRLLKPNGLLVANIFLQRNFNQFLPKETRLENEIILKIPSLDEQVVRWRKVYEESGFKRPKFEIHFPNYKFQSATAKFEHIAKFVPNSYKSLLRNELSEEEKEKTIESFRDLTIKQAVTKFGEPPYDSFRDTTNVREYEILVTFAVNSDD